jgi:hypothetical protein
MTHPISVARVVVAYLCAVNAATLSFTIINNVIVLSRAEVIMVNTVVTVAIVAAVVFWIVAFITAMLPVAVTYAIARHCQIRSIFYYLACGALTGAALAPIFVRVDWHEDDPTFLEEWLRDMPMFAAVGACAAAMFWYKTGQYISLRPRTAS